MDEQNKVVTIPPTQTQVPESHVEIKEPTSPASQQHEDDNRELNKMSQLERERNEAHKLAEDAERRAREAEESAKAIKEDLNSTFQNDPGAYDRFIEGYNRLHPDRPLRGYNEVYGQRKETPAQPAYQPVAEEQVATRAAAQVQAQMALETFTEEHPELRLTTATPENRAVMDKVTKLADFYVSQYGMRPLEALREAHASQPENRGRQASEAKEVGELVGTAKAYASGVGVGSSPSGGTPNIPSSDVSGRLNPSQKKRYDELVSKNPDIAKRYLDNALGL